MNNQKPEEIHPIILRKKSGLIQMENKVSLVERKIFNVFLLYIMKDKKNEKGEYCVPTHVFKDLIGFQENDRNEEFLKKCFRKLVNTSVEFNVLRKSKNKWTVSALISFATIDDGMVTYDLPAPIKEKIISEQMFAPLNLRLQSQFKSKYGLALYENIKDYIRLGKITIFLNDFRKIMGVDDSQYQRFDVFRIKVLDAAVNDINRIGVIDLQYELIRSGRVINWIVFKFKDKENLEAIDPLSEKTDDELILNEFIESLMKTGKVNNKIAYKKTLLEAHKNGSLEGFEEYKKDRIQKQEKFSQGKVNIQELEKDRLLEEKMEKMAVDQYEKMSEKEREDLREKLLNETGYNIIYKNQKNAKPHIIIFLKNQIKNEHTR